MEELLKAIRWITREEGLSAIIVEQHPQMILAISTNDVNYEYPLEIFKKLPYKFPITINVTDKVVAGKPWSLCHG